MAVVVHWQDSSVPEFKIVTFLLIQVHRRKDSLRKSQRVHVPYALGSQAGVLLDGRMVLVDGLHKALLEELHRVPLEELRTALLGGFHREQQEGLHKVVLQEGHRKALQEEHYEV